MRLIDADALDMAFTNLRFNQDMSLAHWGDRKDWCLHGHEVEKLIHDAPTIGGWIRVKDKLPEKEGQYLCWVHINKVYFCHQIHLWYSNAWRWANNNVLYWMSLPEPPEMPKEAKE